MKRNYVTLISVVIIAALLIGEIIVYTSGTHDFDIEAERSADEIEYSIGVRGAQVYSVITLDNKGMLPMTEIYVYLDESYASNYQREPGPIGSNPLNQTYYVDQLVKLLENRGSTPVRVVNATELEVAMNADIGTSFQKGLVVISGALPDTIYDVSNNTIFDWLNDGGRLYWAGNFLGKYVGTPDGIQDGPSNYQDLFFGAECLTTDAPFVDEDDVTNSLRKDLSLKNNDVKFAVDTSKLPAGKNYMTAGYANGNCSSITFVEYGDGVICVLAGDLQRTQYSDLAQIISANITYTTEVIGNISGNVRYGNVSGVMDVTGFTDVSVYICLGGYYPVYGRFFSL